MSTIPIVGPILNPTTPTTPQPDLSSIISSATNFFNQDLTSQLPPYYASTQVATVSSMGLATIQGIQTAQTNSTTQAIDTLTNGVALLHMLALAGDTQIIPNAISKGATVDVLDSTNMTPLHKAAQEGQLNTLKVLVQNNASRTGTDSSGRSVIQLAAISKSANNPAMLQYFMSLGN